MTARRQIVSHDGRAPASSTVPALPAVPIAVRRHALVREVDRQLARCGLTFGSSSSDPATLPRTPPSIVVAVSGGPDSTALLLACIALGQRRRRASAGVREVRGVGVIAAHVHHHLRESADADAQCVADLCARLGVPMRIEHVRPGDLKGNVSANARRLRYQALAAVAREVGAEHVAVAHHAEDQMETMIMAMCRGAGARGLAAMRSTRRMNGVTIVRPLLGVLKRDCEDMCRKAGIEWREDPSNLDVSRRRARLRRDVTPVLEELWPGAARRAAKCATILAQACDE